MIYHHYLILNVNLQLNVNKKKLPILPHPKTKTNPEIINNLIIAGANNTCIISKKKGQLRCWGSTDYKQLPPPPQTKTGTLDMKIGVGRMCAIFSSSALTCWGFNEYAQCDIPFKFKNNIVLITAGSLFSCALRYDLSGLVGD